MTFAAAPEYQVFPTREVPLKPYEAAVRAARTTREFVASFAPDVAVADILTAAPALAAELEGVPRGDARPPRLPGPAAGVPAVLDRRAAAAHAGRAARCGRGRTGSWPWGVEQGRVRVQRLPRAARAPAAAVRAQRALALADDDRDVPAARVPAGVAGVDADRRADAVGAGRAARWSRRPGDGPVVLVATSTSQDPSHSLLTAVLDGLADEPVRVIAISERARGARERGARAVDVLRRDDAALRPRDLPRRARDGRAGAGERRAGADLPGGRRHGRERRAGGLGGRRRAARAAVLHAVGRAAGRPAGAARRARCGSGPASSARWARAHPGPATAATQLERWAATVETASYRRAEGPAA